MPGGPPDAVLPSDIAAALEASRAELAALREEYRDLKLLYEATIAHGEAVEDQLAESNILLKQMQARLADELNDAARYVQSLLPKHRDADPKTDWLLVPSTELGGDSFGCHDIDPQHFAIYLLDVCGHGVGAALLSATVINVLRAAALPSTDFRDPAAVLAALNDAFPMERQDNMFFTIWYGVYDRASGWINYARGGHPPAILRHGGGADAETLLLDDGNGAVIGAMPGVTYPCARVAVGPGDTLLVLSDGTYEVTNPSGAMLCLDDLAAFVRKADADVPSRILGWVRGFQQGETLNDDFSVMALTF